MSTATIEWPTRADGEAPSSLGASQTIAPASYCAKELVCCPDSSRPPSMYSVGPTDVIAWPTRSVGVKPPASSGNLQVAWSHAAKNVDLGRGSLKGHGLSVESELRGISSRVLRAAPSLQMQSVEPVVASYGAARTPL